MFGFRKKSGSHMFPGVHIYTGSQCTTVFFQILKRNSNTILVPSQIYLASFYWVSIRDWFTSLPWISLLHWFATLLLDS
jgi:hypothetical protein